MTVVPSRKAGIIAGVVVAIIVIAVVAWIATQYAAPGAAPKVRELLIGAPLPFTSDLREEAEFSKCLMSLAADEVNRWLNEVGLPYRIKLVFDDDMCSPEGSRKATQSLEAQGVKVYIGYMCSAAFGAAIPYVQSKHYFAVSIASTSPLLRTKAAGGELDSRKYTYRMPPPDTVQGKAIVEVAKESGIKALCVIYREDTWGKGLAAAISKYGSEEGVEVKTIPYPPTATDFSAQLAELSRCLSGYTSKYGADKVAVVAVSFGELEIILKQANESFPDVLKYWWLGTDGIARHPRMVDPKICPITTKVRLTSTIYKALARLELIKKVLEEAKIKCGIEITAPTYPVLAYDAVWITALAYVKTLVEKGTFDADYMDRIFREVAKAYSETGTIVIAGKKYKLPHLSLSGTIEFDESNDRVGNVYELVEVVGTPTKCDWKTVGEWVLGKGVIWTK